MTPEEVRIKTGVDNSAISAGMVDLHKQVEKGTKSIKGSLKLLKDFGLGLGFANIFNIGDSLSEGVLDFGKRMAELGKWWGTFWVGGVKGVQEIRDAEAVLESDRQRFHRSNEDRWDAERQAAEDRIAAAKKELEMLNARTEFEKYLISLQMNGASPGKMVELLNAERDKTLQQLRSLGPDDINSEKYFSLQRELASNERRLTEAIAAKVEQEKNMVRAMEREKELKKLIADDEKKLAQQQAQVKAASLGQANEQYLPTLEELARNRRSPVRGIANRILFLEQDTRVANQLGNFDYAKGNVREIQSLKENLKNMGFLPDDKFEKMTVAAETTASELQALRTELKTNGIMIADS